MNLNDLVPPLELCKLIPAGEFADSIFIWGYSCDKRNTEPFVDERDCVEYCRKNMVNAPPMFPAPTLQEIISDLPHDVCFGFEQHGDFWVSQEYGPCFEERNPPTAALRLWISLKGESNKMERE